MEVKTMPRAMMNIVEQYLPADSIFRFLLFIVVCYFVIPMLNIKYDPTYSTLAVICLSVTYKKYKVWQSNRAI